MTNNKGAATTDFLFALVLVSGFSFIIFALSMTLMMIEVVQYMTFASARAYYAGHIEEKDQVDLGRITFNNLLTSSTLTPLFRGGWFKVDTPYVDRNLTQKYPEMQGYRQSKENSDLFHGTYVKFQSKVLAFQIPLYGTTESDTLRGGPGFFATIGSYLGREVTHRECENIMIDKWEKIKQLDTGSSAPYTQAVPGGSGGGGFTIITDNGC